jgi:hypothetical protein
LTNQVTYRVRIAAAAATFLTGVTLLAGAGLLSNEHTLAAIAPAYAATLTSQSGEGSNVPDRVDVLPTETGVYSSDVLGPVASSMMAAALQDHKEAKAETQVDLVSALTKDPYAAVAKSDFVLLDDSVRTFKTKSDALIPKALEAVRRALADVGKAKNVCSDGVCKDMCDHVVGDIWGYEFASGYETAYDHWKIANSQGLAHPDSRNIPVGALVFYQLRNPAGHVAVYVGNGLVVGSMSDSNGDSNIFLTSADYFLNNPNNKYLGWAYPVFFGDSQGAAL